MKATPSTLRIALLASLVGSLVACGPDFTTDELDTTLHQSYGALDEADEAEDFGDADVAGLDGSDDMEVDDSTAEADPSLAEAEQDGPQVRRLIISVAWGHLRPRPGVEEITNWSGRIAINNGALRVLRTIAFEEHDRLLPRQNVKAVPFISHTAPHADGLLLEVILHPALVTEPDSPPVITMQTASYVDSLALVPGMRLSRVVPVDETGNVVAYHIFRPSADGCKNGLLVGRYTEAHTTDDGRTVGYMKGKYLSFDGTVAGKIKGIWGERENGAQVFFAKVINRQGVFTGILAGGYGDGKLKGRYLGRGRQVTGAVQGIYREAPEDLGGGFFMGRWSVGCGELSTEGEVDASDEANQAPEAELPEDGE